MKMKLLFSLGLCALLGTGLLPARTWTSADGTKTFVGDFKSYDSDGDKVTVTMRNGRSMTFSIDKLSESDQEWVKEQPSEQDLAAATEAREAFGDSDLGKALKDLQILDGRRFKDHSYENPPEYFILYFTASW